MKTKNENHNINKNNVDQSIQSENNTRKKYSKYVEGIFWIISGTYLLLGSFFPITHLNNIAIFIVGIFLVGSSLFIKLNKFYFFLGFLLLGIWLGNIFADKITLRWVWPTIILVMGCAIITYGIAKNPLKKVRYVVSGSIIVIISLFFFLSIYDRISFSDILRKAWPSALILLGLTRISSIMNASRQPHSNTSISNDDDDDDDDDMDSHTTDDTVNDTSSDA